MYKGDEDWDAFEQCISYVDEVFVDMRKGVAQCRYIGEITANSEYWNEDNTYHKVPDYLVGFWMMEYQTNLNYMGFSEAVRNEEWVKCEKIETITYEYVEV